MDIKQIILEELEGISDEELLKEYEWAEEHMDGIIPNLEPDPDEFEEIWRRIQEERKQ
ncbi:hypothetical protein [Enterocloster citroniae]|uniref:hypothetical protein n=1 Tax=Enterocloster citroniae TaxID=358743 RepID=UPI0034A4E92E